MSVRSFNRGLDDAANGEPERPGQDRDYYDGYYFCSAPEYPEPYEGPEHPEPSEGDEVNNNKPKP